MATELVREPVPNELALYQTAAQIRKQLPKIDEQYDYQQKLAALKLYAKGKEFYVAQLEAEAAMAQTLPQAMKAGDVKAEHKGTYTLTNVVSGSVGGAVVNRWREVAAIPPKERAKYYATEERPTRNGLVRWNRNQTINSDDAVRSRGIVTDLRTLAGSEFGCIYADPPWAYSNSATRSAVGGKGKAAYKATMSVEQICDEPVGQLAADESHLHLWTTNAFLFDAKRVMEAWGFTYKSCFVWVKSQMGIGNYWRVSHEFMLLGIRGTLRFRDHGLKSWIECPRTKHSAKPPKVRDIVMKASPGPYLELYGREAPDDVWTVYGNEITEALF